MAKYYMTSCLSVIFICFLVAFTACVHAHDIDSLVPLQTNPPPLKDMVTSIWFSRTTTGALSEGSSLKLHWATTSSTIPSTATFSVFAYEPDEGAGSCSLPTGMAGSILIVPAVTIGRASTTSTRDIAVPHIPFNSVCFFAIRDLMSNASPMLVHNAQSTGDIDLTVVWQFTGFCSANRCDPSSAGVSSCDGAAQTCGCSTSFLSIYCLSYANDSPLYALTKNSGCTIENISPHQSIAQQSCVCTNEWTGQTCGACGLTCTYGRHANSCRRCECDPHYGGTSCSCTASYFTIRTSGTIALQPPRDDSNNVKFSVNRYRLDFITRIRLALSLDLKIHMNHIVIHEVSSSSIFIEITHQCQNSWSSPTDSLGDVYTSHPDVNSIFNPQSGNRVLSVGDSTISFDTMTAGVSTYGSPSPPSRISDQSSSLMRLKQLALSADNSMAPQQQSGNNNLYLELATKLRGMFDSNKNNAGSLYNLFNVQELVDGGIFTEQSVTSPSHLYFSGCQGASCSDLGPNPYAESDNSTMIVLIVVIVVVVLVIIVLVASILYCRKRKLCCYKAIDNHNNRRKRSRSTTATGKRSGSGADGDSHSGSEGSSTQHSGSGSSGSHTSHGSHGRKGHSSGSSATDPRISSPTPSNAAGRTTMKDNIEMNNFNKKVISPTVAGNDSQSVVPDDPRPLPPGWKLAFDQNGKIYYVNTKSLTSSWKHPADMADDGDSDEEVNIVEDD